MLQPIFESTQWEFCTEKARPIRVHETVGIRESVRKSQSSSAAELPVKFQSDTFIIPSISGLRDFKKYCGKTSVLLVITGHVEILCLQLQLQIKWNLIHDGKPFMKWAPGPFGRSNWRSTIPSAGFRYRFTSVKVYFFSRSLFYDDMRCGRCMSPWPWGAFCNLISCIRYHGSDSASPSFKDNLSGWLKDCAYIHVYCLYPTRAELGDV